MLSVGAKYPPVSASVSGLEAKCVLRSSVSEEVLPNLVFVPSGASCGLERPTNFNGLLEVLNNKIYDIIKIDDVSI